MFGVPPPRFRIYTDLPRYMQALQERLSGSVLKGDSVQELERELARRTGAKYAICTPTARTGIYLALAALIEPGQKVLLSPITIVDVINMVLCARGRPVFLDVEPNTSNVDAAEVEKNIDKDTGAVFITHLHGLACDVERIRKACDAHGVPLVEDAAQAYSAKVNGKFLGTFGKAGIYSFGLYKNVNAFYGGAIVTSDDALYKKLRAQVDAMPLMDVGYLYKRIRFGLATDLSTLPLPFALFTYWFFRYGQLHNIEFIKDLVTVDRHPKRNQTMPPHLLCRMTPMQARMILKQLDRVDTHNQKRIEAAKLYWEGLSGLPGVIVPPLRTDESHIYTYYAIRVPDRQALNRTAFHHYRDLVLSHYHNTASLDIFREYYRDCPEAQKTANQLIYLPTYPRYPEDEIKKNIEMVRRFIRS